MHALIFTIQFLIIITKALSGICIYYIYILILFQCVLKPNRKVAGCKTYIGVMLGVSLDTYYLILTALQDTKAWPTCITYVYVNIFYHGCAMTLANNEFLRTYPSH